jgi:hypothetical protein
MKTTQSIAILLALGSLALSGQVMAACAGTPLDETQLEGTFGGNTVCATRGNDSWQEYHQVGGALIDWKRGPNDTVDPSKQVGTWSIQGTGGNASMVYDYGSGGTFSYQVYDNGGGSYSFCDGGELTVTVRPGQGAC